mgnify:CR=1 FL=1
MTVMGEAGLQAAVIDLAHLLGWRIFHARPAQNSRGDWRTAVSADGAGFPDLVMARKGVVIFAELKSEKGRLSPAQEAWLAALAWNGNCRSFVWRPADWLGGRIERALH